MSWVGLDNYRWLFTNPSFYNALGKTITIGVLSTVPQLALALGLAHLLNYRLRGRTFLRVAMLMPYATSVAAATLVFALLFGRDAGLVPTILFTVVVSTIGASQLFGEPLLFGGGLANGGPANQYQTLGLFMYQQGWQFGQLGRAATVAWVTFVLIVGLVLLNSRLLRRGED